MNELRFSYLPEIFRQLVYLIPLSGARQSDGVGDRKLSVSFVAIASMTLHQGRPPDPSSTVQ